MKMNGLISFIIVILRIVFVTGFTEKHPVEYTYNLNQIAHCDSLYVTKTEYYDDRVEIQIESEISEDHFKFASADEPSAKTEAGDNVLILYSDNPESVTSLHISNSWIEIDFRYLNTDTYACIWRTWADDLGWMEYSGDTDRFYTEEEKRQQREAEERRKEQIKKAQKEDEELFGLFQGKWLSHDGDYFKIWDDASEHGHYVEYYQNTHGTVGCQSFVFSRKGEENRYQMTCSYDWGVYAAYEIEYPGADYFLYAGKEFFRVDETE